MTGARRRPPGDGRHVCIIVQNMPVPLDRRVWAESQTLVAGGYRVSVICPKGPGEASFEWRDGVELHRYRPAPAADGVVGYAVEFVWSLLWATYLARRIHRRDPVAVLQACNPPDTYWLLGMLFRLGGTRFVFDHHDLCPELYRSRGRPWSPALLRVLELLERATYRHADAVIATNSSYRRIACARTGRSSETVAIIRNGPAPERMKRGSPCPELRAGHDHLVCYLGIMGPQDGVDVVVRSAAVVAHEMGRHDIRFALLGYGDCLDDLQHLTRTLHVDEHVHFTGRVEIDEITRWLSTADVGLSPDPWTPFNDVSTMNKTLEYMAYALPVVAFDLTETEVSAGSAALYVPHTGDPDADVHLYAQALVALVDDPQRRQGMALLGRARIEDVLGWPGAARRYLELVDALTGHGPRADAPAPRPDPDPLLRVSA